MSHIAEFNNRDAILRMKKTLYGKLACYHMLNLSLILHTLLYLLTLIDGDQWSISIQASFIGFNLCCYLFVQILFNVSFMVSSIWSILYPSAVFYILKTYKNYDSDFLAVVIFQAFSMTSSLILYFYIQEREKRLNFLK